jgi:hypothetical protein
VWLAGQLGFRSKIAYSDADYFNLSEEDARIATAKRQARFPSIDEVKQVIDGMPHGTEIERRDRAMIAFTLLTAARDGAIASMSLKHVDVTADCVSQDAREVQTKNSKSFETFFFPVGEDIPQTLEEWIVYLRDQEQWGPDDPLFPVRSFPADQTATTMEATGEAVSASSPSRCRRVHTWIRPGDYLSHREGRAKLDVRSKREGWTLLRIAEGVFIANTFEVQLVVVVLRSWHDEATA